MNIVITGANGFLGSELVAQAKKCFPHATLVALGSQRSGGVDLTSSQAAELLQQKLAHLDPEKTTLIHAAAKVDWNGINGLAHNVAMAGNVAAWARFNKICFSVLVSGVNVYPSIEQVDAHTQCAPQTNYGIGKVAAEEVWRSILPSQQCAVVRIAGIFGWQQSPTLFWNRLLLQTAKQNDEVMRVNRLKSKRNYISAAEASECLLRVGAQGLSGTYLAAGRNVVDTEKFLFALEQVSGRKLSVEIRDDGLTDACLYEPSSELMSWLKPFDLVLAELWKDQPAWVSSIL